MGDPNSVVCFSAVTFVLCFGKFGRYLNKMSKLGNAQSRYGDFRYLLRMTGSNTADSSVASRSIDGVAI